MITEKQLWNLKPQQIIVSHGIYDYIIMKILSLNEVPKQLQTDMNTYTSDYYPGHWIQYIKHEYQPNKIKTITFMIFDPQCARYLQIFTEADLQKYCTCSGQAKRITLFTSSILECTQCGKEKKL